jgi:hypothetical protein
MPGDCYEVVGAHRLKVCGPRRACTPQENAAVLKTIIALAAHEIDADMAGELVEEILAAHGPLPPPHEEPPWEPGADG